MVYSTLEEGERRMNDQTWTFSRHVFVVVRILDPASVMLGMGGVMRFTNKDAGILEYTPVSVGLGFTLIMCMVRGGKCKENRVARLRIPA